MYCYEGLQNSDVAKHNSLLSLGLTYIICFCTAADTTVVRHVPSTLDFVLVGQGPGTQQWARSKVMQHRVFKFKPCSQTVPPIKTINHTATAQMKAKSCATLSFAQISPNTKTPLSRKLSSTQLNAPTCSPRGHAFEIMGWDPTFEGRSPWL